MTKEGLQSPVVAIAIRLQTAADFEGSISKIQ
jgi:hypothetical protein